MNDFRATYEVCDDVHTVYARDVDGPVIGFPLVKVYGTGGQPNCEFRLNHKIDNATYCNTEKYERGCQVFFRVLVQFTGGGSVERRAVLEESNRETKPATAKQA